MRNALLRAINAATICAVLLSCGSSPTRQRLPNLPRALVTSDCRQTLRIDLPWSPHSGIPGRDSALVTVKFIDMSNLQPVSGFTIRALSNDYGTIENVPDFTGTSRIALKYGRYRLEFYYIGYQLMWNEVVLTPGSSLYATAPAWQIPVC